MTPDLVKILFALNHEDWHQTPGETLWARPIDPHRPAAFVLENTPFFAKGVSYKDVVRAVMRDGALEFAGVIDRGGRSTFRLLFDRETNLTRNWWAKLQQLGCSREWGDVGSRILYAVDVPPQVDLDQVYAILKEGEVAQVWLWEEGHVSHSTPVPPASLDS